MQLEGLSPMDKAYEISVLQGKIQLCRFLLSVDYEDKLTDTVRE